MSGNKGNKISVGSDPIVSLKYLKIKVDEWISKYGEDAVFTTDAGHNNVDLIVDTRIKSINECRKHGDEL